MNPFKTREPHRGNRLYYSLGLLALISVALCWQGVNWSAHYLFRDQAFRAGRNWVTFIKDGLEDIDALLAGEALSAMDQELIKAANKAVGIVRYKLIDGEGKVVAASHPEDVGKIEKEAYFQDIVKNGSYYFKTVEPSSQQNQGLVLGEAYAPIMEGDQFKGAVEIYVNVTDTNEHIQQFKWSAFGALALLFGVFGLLTIIMVRWHESYRNRAEDALRQSKRLLDTLINSLPFWICVTDRDGGFLVVNQSMSDDVTRNGMDLGASEGEGWRGLERQASAGWPRFSEHSNEVLTTGEAIEAKEIEIVAKDGHTRSRNLKMVPLEGNGSSAAGVISWSEDITERVQRERELADQIEEMERISTQLNHLNEQLNLNTKVMQADLAMAAELQQGLFSPVENLPFVNIGIRFLPYGKVSGDIYKLSVSNDGALNVFVGDATGHGIPAAFLTMMTNIGLDYIQQELSPPQVMEELNHLLATRELRGRFLTGVCARLSPQGLVTASQAGHPPLILLLKQESDPVMLEENGLPLGLFSPAKEPYTEKTYQLSPGDKFFLYTDGVVELKSKNEESYGIQRLTQSLVTHRSGEIDFILSELLQDMERFSGMHTQHDDMIILGFEYTGDQA